MHTAKIIILILISFTVSSKSSQQCITLNTSEYTVAGFKMIDGKWHAFVDDQNYAPENLHEAMEAARMLFNDMKMPIYWISNLFRNVRVFLARPWHVYFFYIQKNSTHYSYDDLRYIFYSDPDPSTYPKRPMWRSGLVPTNSYDLSGMPRDFPHPNAYWMTLFMFMRADDLNRFHYRGTGNPYGENEYGQDIDYNCWPLPWSNENNGSIPRLYQDCCKGDINRTTCLPDIGTGKYYTRQGVYDDYEKKNGIDFMIHCNGFYNRPLEDSELTVYTWEDEDNPKRSDLCFDLGFKPSFAVEIYRKAWAHPDENGKFVYGCKSILPDELRTTITVQTTTASTENAENATTENPNNYNSKAEMISSATENATTKSPNKAEMISSATLSLYSLVLGIVFWMTISIKILQNL